MVAGVEHGERCRMMVQAGVLCIAACFLLFPIANDFLGMVKERPPHGMAPARAAPPLKKKTLRSRAWQRALESRAKQRSGLWRPLTMLANELYSRFFGQISAFNNGSVMLAKEGHLFQAAHLPVLNHRRPGNFDLLPRRAKAIGELQQRLAARGKTLLIVVTPNFAELYPELIPQIYLDPRRKDRPHPYEAVRAAFEREGVQYVDTVELLRSRRDSVPYRFFALTGSHWNDVGSCLALEAINKTLRSKHAVSLRGFACDQVTIEPAPRAKDRDLLDIANLLFPKRLHRPTPYVSVRYTEPAPARQPRALLVGTSYLFALSEHLYDWDLAKDLKLYFYFKQMRQGGERKFRGLNRSKIPWAEILDRELIIVNVGIGNPVTIGYGFIEAALNYLKAQEKAQTLSIPR